MKLLLATILATVLTGCGENPTSELNQGQSSESESGYRSLMYKHKSIGVSIEFSNDRSSISIMPESTGSWRPTHIDRKINQDLFSQYDLLEGLKSYSYYEVSIDTENSHYILTSDDSGKVRLLIPVTKVDSIHGLSTWIDAITNAYFTTKSEQTSALNPGSSLLLK